MKPLSFVLSFLLLLVLWTGCDSSDPAPMFDVAVTAEPAEGGTVTPATSRVKEGTRLTLSAQPADGYRFDRWSGDLSGTSANPSVSVAANMSVTAHFVRSTYDLAVTTEGEGTVAEVVVASDKAYESGTTVKLTATPAEGWRFDGWSGDATGSEPVATVSMDGAKSVIATFVPDTYDLAVTTEGEGTVSEEVATGTVKAYDAGTTVQLTATPATGWTFTGWSGDATGTNPVTTVTMDAAKNVTATFTAEKYTLSFDVAARMYGDEPEATIDWSPKKDTYTYGETVTVTATPAAQTVFSNWQGEGIGEYNVAYENPHTFTVVGDMAIKGRMVTYDYAFGVRGYRVPAENTIGFALSNNMPDEATIKDYTITDPEGNVVDSGTLNTTLGGFRSESPYHEIAVDPWPSASVLDQYGVEFNVVLYNHLFNVKRKGSTQTVTYSPVASVR